MQDCCGKENEDFVRNLLALFRAGLSAENLQSQTTRGSRGYQKAVLGKLKRWLLLESVRLACARTTVRVPLRCITRKDFSICQTSLLSSFLLLSSSPSEQVKKNQLDTQAISNQSLSMELSSNIEVLFPSTAFPSRRSSLTSVDS